MRAAAPQAARAAKAGGRTCATAGMTAVSTAKKGPRTTVPAGYRRGHWCGITKGAREHYHRQRSGGERFRHKRSFSAQTLPTNVCGIIRADRDPSPSRLRPLDRDVNRLQSAGAFKLRSRRRAAPIGFAAR